MKFRCATEKRAASIEADAKPDSAIFGTDLSNVFLDYWAAPAGAFLKRLCHNSVYISKGDTTGTVLFGVIERLFAKRSQTYSNTSPHDLDRRASTPLPPPPSRGSVLLMPAAIANLAELLESGAP